MVNDLPDYTKLIAISVAIPDLAAVNAGRYVLVPIDLDDNTRTPLLTDIKGRIIVAQYEKDRTVETLAGKFVRVKGFETDNIVITLTNQSIIPRPMGGITEKAAYTTTANYAEALSHVATNLMTFQVAKIVLSCDFDFMYQLFWNDVAIGTEVSVPANTPYTDWFPWNYAIMAGNGAKKFMIKAKFPTGGEAGTLNAEIVGEEYTT